MLFSLQRTAENFSPSLNQFLPSAGILVGGHIAFAAADRIFRSAWPSRAAMDLTRGRDLYFWGTTFLPLAIPFFFNNRIIDKHCLKQQAILFTMQIAYTALRLNRAEDSLGTRINRYSLPNILKIAAGSSRQFFGYVYGWTHTKGDTFLKYVYNNAIIPPICEELLFRGLLQEVLLRQLPKLALKTIVGVPTDIVDHPIAKIMRIGVVAILFAVVHMDTTQPVSSNTYLGVQMIIPSIQLGYIGEVFGVQMAILSHFNNNLQCAIMWPIS